MATSSLLSSFQLTTVTMCCLINLSPITTLPILIVTFTLDHTPPMPTGSEDATPPRERTMKHHSLRHSDRADHYRCSFVIPRAQQLGAICMRDDDVRSGRVEQVTAFLLTMTPTTRPSSTSHYHRPLSRNSSVLGTVVCCSSTRGYQSVELFRTDQQIR